MGFAPDSWTTGGIPKQSTASNPAPNPYGGFTATATAGTIQDQAAALYTMSDAERKLFAQKLKDAGYKIKVSGAKGNTLAIADALLLAQQEQLTAETRLGKKYATVDEFLAEKKSGAVGTGAPKAYATISPLTTAAGLINDAYQRNLNRDATKAEIDTITKKLNAAEKKNPQKTVNGLTTGGLDRNQFLDEIVKARPEFKKRIESKTALNTETLMSTAKANGLNPNPLQLQEWNKRIQNGEDINVIKKSIRDTAALGLPDNIKKLMADGTDLETIYAPYKNVMYQTLELNPDAINLNDSTLRSAIGPNGEMPIYDFQRALRKDPRWQYTNNAREDVSNSVTKVLQDFGFVG
jgi:hypothetical protein